MQKFLLFIFIIPICAFIMLAVGLAVNPSIDLGYFESLFSFAYPITLITGLVIYAKMWRESYEVTSVSHNVKMWTMMITSFLLVPVLMYLYSYLFN